MNGETAPTPDEPGRGVDDAGEGLREVEAAIARIEESRRSHQAWAEHIPACDHCQEHGPPPYIQTQAEHEQIVHEYDSVLAVLRRALLAETAPAADKGQAAGLVVHFEPPPPQVIPVRVPCPRCGQR